jgi:hypothetical protein
MFPELLVKRSILNSIVFKMHQNLKQSKCEK